MPGRFPSVLSSVCGVRFPGPVGEGGGGSGTEVPWVRGFSGARTGRGFDGRPGNPPGGVSGLGSPPGGSPLPFPARLSPRPRPCPISGQKGRRGRGVLGLPAAPGGLDRPPDSGECTAGRGPLESGVASSSSRVVRSGVRHHHPPLLPGNHQKEPCPYHHHRLLLLLLTHAAQPAQRSGPSAWRSKPIVVSTDAALCRETRKVRHCRRMQEEA